MKTNVLSQNVELSFYVQKTFGQCECVRVCVSACHVGPQLCLYQTTVYTVVFI